MNKWNRSFYRYLFIFAAILILPPWASHSTHGKFISSFVVICTIITIIETIQYYGMPGGSVWPLYRYKGLFICDNAVLFNVLNGNVRQYRSKPRKLTISRRLFQSLFASLPAKTVE